MDETGLWILIVVCATTGVAYELARRRRHGRVSPATVADALLTGLGIGLSAALLLFAAGLGLSRLGL